MHKGADRKLTAVHDSVAFIKERGSAISFFKELKSLVSNQQTDSRETTEGENYSKVSFA